MVNGQLSVFTTRELLNLTGLTRVQVQRLEAAGAIKPDRVGRNRACPNLYAPMQVVAAAYFKAFFDAKCDPTWSYAACAWVARQHPGFLLTEFARLDAEAQKAAKESGRRDVKGIKAKALLFLSADGEGRLIDPKPLKPGASREQHIRLAMMNLRPIYERIMRREHELADEFWVEEAEVKEGQCLSRRHVPKQGHPRSTPKATDGI